MVLFDIEDKWILTMFLELRQKIEKVGPQVIQTVWGVGYKFDDTEAE